MKSGFLFADDDQVKNSLTAISKMDPEILDHIIQQTEVFKKNMEVARMVNEDQPFGCTPEEELVNIKQMKEIFYRSAPDVIIQLAYRVKYLQESLEK
jgi:hypothetical protein